MRAGRNENTPPMKSNRLTMPSPDETRSLASAIEIVSSLLRFFQDFGFERDARFAGRASVLAFTNALILAKENPADAAKLVEALELPAAFQELARITAAELVAEVPDDDEWVTNLWRSLPAHWEQMLAPKGPNSLNAQIVFSLSVGLAVGTHEVDFAAMLIKRVLLMNVENRFIACRLNDWSDNQFRPLSSPFLEFVSYYYCGQPVERRVMLQEAGETHACASHLPDPWRIAFWVEQGWARGRHLAEQHPDVVRRLLEEASAEDRAFMLKLYQELVIKPAEANGQVDIEQATLAFFAASEGGRCAVEYCKGDQPQKMARLAFDFALWMGIVSALPIPRQEAA